MKKEQLNATLLIPSIITLNQYCQDQRGGSRRGVQGMEEEVKGWGMVVLEQRQPFVRYGNVRWRGVVGDVAAPQFFNTTIPPPTCPSSRPLNTVAVVPACSVHIRKRDSNCVTQFKIDEKIIVIAKWCFHVQSRHHNNFYCELVNLMLTSMGISSRQFARNKKPTFFRYFIASSAISSNILNREIPLFTFEL